MAGAGAGCRLHDTADSYAPLTTNSYSRVLELICGCSRLQTLATVSSLAAVDRVRDILTLGPVCGDQHWPGVSWATCHVSRVPVFRMLGCTGPRSSACVCSLLVTVCMQCCSALCFSMQHCSALSSAMQHCRLGLNDAHQG